MSDTQAVRAREAVVEQMSRAFTAEVKKHPKPPVHPWEAPTAAMFYGLSTEDAMGVALDALLTSPQLVDVLVEAQVLVEWGGVDQDGHAADLEDIRSDEQYRASFYAEFGKLTADPVWTPLFRAPSRSTPTDE